MARCELFVEPKKFDMTRAKIWSMCSTNPVTSDDVLRIIIDIPLDSWLVDKPRTEKDILIELAKMTVSAINDQKG